MSPNRRTLLAALAALPLSTIARAADPRDTAVGKLIELLRAEYQDAVLAARLADALTARHAAGAYAGAGSDEDLAKLLTDDLRAVVDDRHLVVLSGLAPGDEDPSSDANFQRKINYGVQSVRRLPGNIGLIELSFFPSLVFGTRLTGRYAAAMALVAQTRALIVDIRQHMGGEPACVAYFASYFFERAPFLLNEIVYRRKPTEQFRTVAAPDGTRYGERRPVYVVTSRDSFSGAEEFAYDLQAFKRATIIGEVTGGGANPNAAFALGGSFTAFIPNGRAVNPVTHTNWEGVGVKPDVPVPATKGIDVAQRLALQTVLAQAADPDEKSSIQEAISALPPS